MIILGAVARRPVAHPVGEVLFTGVSQQNWVCPPGVTRVSLVCIGPGGASYQQSLAQVAIGGGGGGLCYKNDVTVVPGTTYVIRSAGAYSSAFGLTAKAGGAAGPYSGSSNNGGTASGGDANYTGGGGQVKSPPASGGGAARYNSNGATGGGAGTGVDGNNNGNYGAGGGCGPGTPGAQPGAVRIIWGDGRSFPNNAQ